MKKAQESAQTLKAQKKQLRMKMHQAKKDAFLKKQKAQQKEEKAQQKAQLKEKKEKLKDYKKRLDSGYTMSIIKDENWKKLVKENFSQSDFKEYVKLLDSINSTKTEDTPTIKKSIVKGAIYEEDRFSDDASIKGIILHEFKQYKKNTKNRIQQLEDKKAQYIIHPHLIELLDRRIKKEYFYLQTYSQQVFDLLFEAPTLQKYNSELLHFDLLLKSETLNTQLLYYRLCDIKARAKDFDSYIMDSDYVKSNAVYNQTENKILDNITNAIILEEIAKNDAIKLDFLRVYYNKLYKNRKSNADKTRIMKYKKYIIDRYGYLLCD